MALWLAILLLAPLQAHAESAGCAQVNGGAWNTSLQSFGIGATLTVFTNGDRITFTITGTGQFSLLASSDGNGFINVLIVNPPGHATFTIAAPFAVFRILNAAVSGLLNITATCTPATAPSQQHGAATKSFMLGRINGILLIDPSGTSLLNRFNTSGPQQIASANGSAGAAPFGGSGLGQAMALGAGRFADAAADAAGSKNIWFSQSLSQLQRNAAQAQDVSQDDRMELGAANRRARPPAYQVASPWDVWVEGRYSAFDDDSGNIDRNGHVGVLYVGSDYRIGRNLMVGALAQFDWSKDESRAAAAKVGGTGWMIGPYLAARFDHNIYFDLRAAWGRSSNDLTLGTATGDFDTSRWLVKGALSGNWLWDRWRVTPKAELAYVTESQASFTNSEGTVVSQHAVGLGRLQFGPEIGYRFAHSTEMFIEPFAAMRGVWDFDKPNVALIDGIVVGPGDFWGRLEGGLNVVTSSGVVVRGLASWDGVGAANYSGYTLHGTVNVPLQ